MVENVWFKFPKEIRFFITGCFNALISYIFYVIFCHLLGADCYQYALIIAWFLSSLISFNAQKYLVFQSSGSSFKEYLKCCVTWFFSYLINAGFLELAVKVFLINIFIAQIAANLCAAVFTYVLFKKFAFNSVHNS